MYRHAPDVVANWEAFPNGRSQARVVEVGKFRGPRVVQAVTNHDDLLSYRLWMLRKDGREPTIDLRAVPGVGAEIVLTVDGELRRTRLYRAHEQAEL
jgi:hypothetical protein